MSIIRVGPRSARALRHHPVLWCVMAVLAACAENPVTGERELGLVSTAEEVSIGEQNYGPMQQSQGGELVTDPALTAYVTEVGQRLAEVSDRELPYEFVVLNNGVPNAWAMPGGKIAINRGLLVELENEAELAAVLGHEIVHSAARHGAQSMERGMLLQGALVATSIAASDSPYADFIVGGAQVGAQLISQRYGRDAERESDRYGTRYLARAGYDPAAAVSLQEKFLALSEGRRTGWLEGLFASHPPSAKRVENNRELVAGLRAEGFTDGELGEARYREQTAFLRENREAYEQLDRARSLFGQGDLEPARELSVQARDRLPREPATHGLVGEIELARGQPGQALDAFSAALERDRGYYGYHLGRGLALSRLGRGAEARRELEASVELLPTAAAMSELGTLALQAGERQEAKSYFEQAAQAPGEAGERAMASYVRLDMTDNPGRYLTTASGLDRNGELLIQVRNESPVSAQGVTVALEAVLGGQRATRRLDVGTLDSGATQTLRTALTLPEGGDPSQLQVSTMITSARPR